VVNLIDAGWREETDGWHYRHAEDSQAWRFTLAGSTPMPRTLRQRDSRPARRAADPLIQAVQDSAPTLARPARRQV